MSALPLLLYTSAGMESDPDALPLDSLRIVFFCIKCCWVIKSLVLSVALSDDGIVYDASVLGEGVFRIHVDLIISFNNKTGIVKCYFHLMVGY